MREYGEVLAPEILDSGLAQTLHVLPDGTVLVPGVDWQTADYYFQVLAFQDSMLGVIRINYDVADPDSVPPEMVLRFLTVPFVRDGAPVVVPRLNSPEKDMAQLSDAHKRVIAGLILRSMQVGHTEE